MKSAGVPQLRYGNGEGAASRFAATQGGFVVSYGGGPRTGPPFL